MFEENKHPRDKDGKFTDGQANKTVEAIRKYSDDPKRDIAEYDNMPSANRLANSVPKKEIKIKSQEEFFGEEFKGVKGLEAIEKLLKEKRGHVKNAFERSELGGIDLVWGDENGGLMHTILKRDKLFAKGNGNISGIDMVRKIPSIIEQGDITQDDKGRINIDYENYRVGIMPTFYNKKIKWIVTAMEVWK